MSNIGFSHFSLLSALGNNLETHFSNAIKGSLSGIEFDSNLNLSQGAMVGRIKIPLKDITSNYNNLNQFNYRANKLITLAIEPLLIKIEELKTSYNSQKIGIILGTSTSGADSFDSALTTCYKKGDFGSNYFSHHQRMGGVSEFCARYLSILGPTMTVTTACSSSTKAINHGVHWLKSGICDVVIVGGVDIISDLTIQGFSSLGALSNEHTNPFSLNRRGINIGEGVGLFILEKKDTLISILGCGNSSDGYHISAPDPTGKGASIAIKRALNDAKLESNKIDYVNLHGTGTEQNDNMESKAIDLVFNEPIIASSTKPLTGHCLGASGAIEVGLTALSMLKEYNKEGNYLPHIFDGIKDPIATKLILPKIGNKNGIPRISLSNSFAFGGSNSCIIIGAN